MVHVKSVQENIDPFRNLVFVVDIKAFRPIPSIISELEPSIIAVLSIFTSPIVI